MCHGLGENIMALGSVVNNRFMGMGGFVFLKNITVDVPLARSLLLLFLAVVFCGLFHEI